jgi:hypothetical protein
MVVVLAGLAAGCNDFKYFDIHVMFSGSFGTAVKEVSVCRVTVSGADSKTFRILDNCPPAVGYDVGKFEFSSFADSGTMNFKVDTYTGLGEKPECINGSGTVAVPVSGGTTLMADLTINKTGAGCSTVTPVTGADGGM